MQISVHSLDDVTPDPSCSFGEVVRGVGGLRYIGEELLYLYASSLWISDALIFRDVGSDSWIPIKPTSNLVLCWATTVYQLYSIKPTNYPLYHPKIPNYSFQLTSNHQ